MLYDGPGRDDRSGDRVDQGAVAGVVAVDDVVVRAVEVGDYHQIEGALVDAGVLADHEPADLGNVVWQRPHARRCGCSLLRAGFRLPPDHDNVAEH
jgi:hypothetical protein